MLKVMKKAKQYFLILIISSLLNACAHVSGGRLRITLDIDYNKNNGHVLLLDGDDGCGRIFENIDAHGIGQHIENFNSHNINIMTVTTYQEFARSIKPYIQLDFIQNTRPEYFDNHILIIIITGTTGGTFFRNARLVNYNGVLQLVAQIREPKIRHRCLSFHYYIIEVRIDE